VSVYLCSQGSGEGLSLSLAEKETVYRAAVATLGGVREVVGAGVGLTGDTDSALEQVERLSATGVDAVQVFPPRTGALRPRDREIERYFDEVIAVASCPVILGENVTLVGYELGPRLIHRIIDKSDAVTGLSYTAAGSLGQLSELVAGYAGRLQIRTGWLHHLVNMAAVGGAGVLCFDGNVAPGLLAATWTAAKAGSADLPVLWRAVISLNVLLSKYGNPGSIKAALSHLGLPAGGLRRPLLGLDETEVAELTATLDRLRADLALDSWL
ncbi:MAG TPA: dihydrodipicolinate synthase family protein, partial [Acidimicrobiales bacterium]|nr:dihydrodipicolinate synthase family protein [Acidimicrobiales bacterium]